jgi:predicted PurR-regulated permease PerM
MQIKQDTQKRWIKYGTIFAIALFAILVISKAKALTGWGEGLLLLLRPTLLGLVLAYFCNPVFRFFERRAFLRLSPPAFRRALSLICTYLILFLVVSAIVWLIVPQLIESIMAFASNYNQHLSSIIEKVNGFLASINATIEQFTGMPAFFEPLKETAIQEAVENFFKNDFSNAIPSLGEQISGLISIVADVIFAIFISVYLLASKEKRYAQVMKVRHALFSTNTNATITRICTVADHTFGRFVEGKLVDCLIVGVILWVSFATFHIPYALLLAAIIAVTNFIPMVGLFIGAVPSIIILLLTSPEQVFAFLIIVVLVQQIDNNIISPKIVGDNTGVSALCVLIALICSGALWGVVGLLFSVPLFATLLTLIDELTVSRLQKRGVPSGIENYYAADTIIDPTKHAHSNTDNLAKKLERAAIQIQAKEEQNQTITRKERFLANVYRFLLNHRFLNAATESDVIRSSARQAAKTIERDASQWLAQTDADLAEGLTPAPLSNQESTVQPASEQISEVLADSTDGVESQDC